MSSVDEAIVRAQGMIQSGQLGPAIELLSRVLAHDANEFRAHTLRSVALSLAGDHESAIESARQAVRLRPQDARLRAHLGKVLIDAGRAPEAVAGLTPLVTSHPHEELAWLRLGEALLLTGKTAQALRNATRALGHHPRSVELQVQRAGAELSMGDAPRAVAALRTAIERDPDNLSALSQLCASLNYLHDADPRDVREAHVNYAQALERALGPSPPAPPAPAGDPARPLRLGLVSHDLGGHSVASFLEPLLTHLDRRAFTIICYASATNEDATTQRLKGLDVQWRRVTPLHLEPMSNLVRADAIDILFDLGGHTACHRLPLFHARVAPVQATYLAYPNTTGLSSIDFRIVDSLTDPPGSEEWNTERLIRLDPCFLCYRPSGERPALAPRPADAPIVFGSFNKLLKLSEPVLRLWGRILAQTPGSTLVVKSWDLTSDDARDHLLARWKKLRLDPARLRILRATPTQREHLALYQDIDLALDTFPYHGTTTTCEALSMGVPVVTLAGRVHASRVGVSLLSAVGLEDLVAHDEDQYVRLATDLARDRARLARLRGELPQRLASSPLCDGPGFAQRFGDVLRQMWQTRVGPGPT